jgi:hypothetical protein
MLKLLTPTDFQVGPGDELWLRPDLERASWFDPEGGARLGWQRMWTWIRPRRRRPAATWSCAG